MGNPEFIDTHVRLAAMRQIHAAIEHFHWQDFECAITLAAAGEGMMPDTEVPHFRKKLVEWQKSLPASMPGATNPNDFSNWLKHGKLNGKQIDGARIQEIEVVVFTYRAVSKFQAVYDDLSPQMTSFLNWATERFITEEVVRRNKS